MAEYPKVEQAKSSAVPKGSPKYRAMVVAGLIEDTAEMAAHNKDLAAAEEKRKQLLRGSKTSAQPASESPRRG